VEKFGDLDTLLILALTHKNHGFKEVQKKALKMAKKKQTEGIVARAILKPIMDRKTHSDSLKELMLFIDEYLYYALPAAEIGKIDAYCGMAILREEEAIPVCVRYESVEDFHWARDNEAELWTAICKDLLWDAYKEIRVPYEIEICKEDPTKHYVQVPHEPVVLTADILMFSKYGYSGSPKHWGLELKKNEPLFLTELVSEDRETPTFYYAPERQVEALKNAQAESESDCGDGC
jgi:hypothetical protein